MTGKTAQLIWDESLIAYDFGPRHPLAPIRLELTIALATALGVLPGDSGPGVLPIVRPEPADDELLQLVHTGDYIAAVRRAGMEAESLRGEIGHGLGTSDDPVFEGMHDAAAWVVGASVEAARAVWRGEVRHAANIAGGLHHAMPAAASGFCVYNDPAIAIAWLLEAGCERIAYVDVDVHHGDGVEAVFADDPRVLTISLHQDTRTLFPGVGGTAEDTGADGTSVNVALPPMTSDRGWLRAFHAVVPPLVEAFDPQVLVTQHGCDSHEVDPLAHLALTVDGQRAAAIALHDLAHRVCEGRWVATGGGGYAVAEVVPRTWTHLLAVLAGHPIDPATVIPPLWREYVQRLGAEDPPHRMTDRAPDDPPVDDRGVPDFIPWPDGIDPDNAVDRSIQRTRRAVFGHHGLTP